MHTGETPGQGQNLFPGLKTIVDAHMAELATNNRRALSEEGWLLQLELFANQELNLDAILAHVRTSMADARPALDAALATCGRLPQETFACLIVETDHCAQCPFRHS